MRIDGPLLFDGPPLTELIEQRIDALARESVTVLLSSGIKVTAAALRRTILAATELHDVPILAEASPIAFSGQPAQVQAITTVRFVGDPVYLSCRTPTSPKLRRVRAVLYIDHLALSAYGSEKDREWMPMLLNAEVQVICAYLWTQALIVRRFNSTRKVRSAELADRIMANLRNNRSLDVPAHGP